MRPSGCALAVGGETEVLRFLMWRMLGLLAAFVGFALIAWFIGGGPGKVLRGGARNDASHLTISALAGVLDRQVGAVWSWAPARGILPARLLLALVSALGVLIVIARAYVRSRRRYVRLGIEVYRSDRADAAAVVTMFDTVQFLDSPGERSGIDAPPEQGPGDADKDDRELAGVGTGAEEDDLVF